MDYAALYDRILREVDEDAYLNYTDLVDPAQREALSEHERYVRSPEFDPDTARTMARRLYAEGRIDKVMMLSALHVVAASPRVRDYNEAMRLAAEQEMAAIELGGPALQPNLASVDRHRGVVFFFMGHHEMALDYFSRAFERQHSAGNLANVLATLLALGDEAEAHDLLFQVRENLSPTLVQQLDSMIQVDPDLSLLRTE